MITIFELAVHRGAKEDERGGINGEEFERVGLPMFGGCQDCGASIAAYNAYPSKSGFLKCKDCIDESGFPTLLEANRMLFADSY
jgi:hypothetical protein